MLERGTSPNRPDPRTLPSPRLLHSHLTCDVYLKEVVVKPGASTYTLHEIQKMLQCHIMNLWGILIQAQDIMAHGSFSESYL